MINTVIDTVIDTTIDTVIDTVINTVIDTVSNTEGPRFESVSALLSSKIVVCGHCLVTLSLTINEKIKWLSSLPI